MAQDATNLIVGQARIWRSPIGEALPDENTVDAGADWGGDWTSPGWTKEGVTMTYEKTENNHEVQESRAPVKTTIGSETFQITTVLAELTAENLSLSWGGVVTLTPPGASQVGMEELDISASDDVCATEGPEQWGFEGDYCDDAGARFPIRFFIYRGTSKLGGEVGFAKDDYAGIGLEIHAEEDSTNGLLKMQKVTAAATP